MRTSLTIIFLFLAITSNSQNANQLLADVIHTKSLKGYNNVIVAELDSTFVNFTLRHLNSNKMTFKSIDTSSAKISLTSKEKRFLITSLRKQVSDKWAKEDFANMNVIEKSEIKEYVRKNNKNGFIYISAPVFIRENNVALVLFGNFYGDVKTGGGISNLSFYKIENGSWKKWITLEDGTYN